MGFFFISTGALNRGGMQPTNEDQDRIIKDVTKRKKDNNSWGVKGAVKGVIFPLHHFFFLFFFVATPP